MPQSLSDWKKVLAPLDVNILRPDRIVRGREPRIAAERLMLFFESGKNLKRYLSEAAGYTPNTGQAEDISACLRQARELLRLATSAELMTKPIILYYGMASLAKALVLSLGCPRRLASLPNKHGLRVPSRYSLPMADLEVGVEGKDGLFHGFVNALDQLAGVPVSVSLGRVFISLAGAIGASDLGSLRATMKDLLLRIVGVEDFLRDTFTEAPLNAVLTHVELQYCDKTNWHPRMTLVFTLPKGTNAEWLIALHPRLKDWRVDAADETGVNLVNLPSALPVRLSPDEEGPLFRPLYQLLMPLARGPSDELRLVGAVEGLTIPEPAIQLAAMFLLSSIARYRPDLWSVFSSFSPDHESLQLRALLEAVFDRALTSYPLQVLAALGRTGIQVWEGRTIMFA
ncbi:MAG TPA: YaaC family protein [Thermoanaerobaculia bacterium]|jgi:hypothetical protein|nr:YaaC family protein [Thermoanaerobaculia bacterium]